MPKQTEPLPDKLPVEDPLERNLAICNHHPAETTPISDAVGRVLAADVVAPFDIPPLDNTAMDGYAVQAADTAAAGDDAPVRLKVIGELAAGYLYDGALGPGQAVRIMTGAPMPDGADAIVPFEETDEEGLRAPGQEHAAIDSVGILKPAKTRANVRSRGEDVRQGATILTQGAVLRGAQIALLASLGIDRVSVIRRPVVAILSTGDELLTPGDAPQPGKIFDSNSFGLAALVREYGGVPLPLGIARDTVDALTAKVHEATQQADLILTSAGVSRGDFDVVKEVLAREGEVRFWTVRMKPGKPLAFGQFNAPNGRRVPHIGLPGNPVSSLLAFELFGRPAIFKLMGRRPQPRPPIRAIADDPIKNTDARRVYARAILSRGEDGRWHARLTGPQGSGVLTSMALAQGFAICPENVDQINPGDEVDVLMTTWDHAED